MSTVTTLKSIILFISKCSITYYSDCIEIHMIFELTTARGCENRGKGRCSMSIVTTLKSIKNVILLCII